jgi:hypothetical protein
MQTRSIYVGQIAFARTFVLRALVARNAPASAQQGSRRQSPKDLLSYLRRLLRRRPSNFSTPTLPVAARARIADSGRR